MLRDRVERDIKRAMKARDSRTLFMLRSIKSAILYKEVSLKRHKRQPLVDAEVRGVVGELIAERNRAVDEWRAVSDQSRADESQWEADFLASYLTQGYEPGGSDK